jgi:hypothetical protein
MPKAMFPATVSHGNDEYDWNTIPVLRPGPCTGTPPSRMAPEEGISSPPAMRMSVVLPQPDGPRNTTRDLEAMASEVSRTTGTVPKDLLTRSKVKKELVTTSS